MKIVIGILSSTLAAIPAIAAAQPNILVILTDDAGYLDFASSAAGAARRSIARGQSTFKRTGL